MKLTNNFNSKEFLVSRSHPELIDKMELTKDDILKAYFLCKFILQPIRDLFGPVVILSGKRDEQLNKAVGGAESSLHLWKGHDCVADITTPQASLEDVYNHIKDTRAGIYGELIWYKRRNFLHVSLANERKINDAFIVE